MSENVSILQDIQLAQAASTPQTQGLYPPTLPMYTGPSLSAPVPTTSALLLYSCLRLAISIPYFNSYLIWQVYDKESDNQKQETDYSTKDGYFKPPVKHIPLDTSLLNTWSNLLYLPTEGLLSPWKGFMAALMKDSLNYTLEPLLAQHIQDLVPLRYDTLAHPSIGDLFPAVLRTLTSDVLFNYITSPFDILRTRMIVQTSANSTYGVFSGLNKVLGCSWWKGTTAYLTITNTLAKGISRHAKNVMLDLVSTTYWSVIALDLVWDVVELIAVLPLDTLLRRSHLLGSKMEDSVCPVNTKVLSKKSLWRGVKLRVGMLIFHKVLSGLLVNMDIDEDY